MVMKIVDSVSLAELQAMAGKMYGTLVKANVDIAKKLLVVDMEMHADGESYLLENGSLQNDLWGINLHPDKFGFDDFVEFDSMINIRPRQNNPSRDVMDEKIRKQIREIVAGVVHE
jgi:Protein of unknown function (DUF5674)